MDIKGNDHIYKVIPNILGNETAENPAIFHLKGISQEDFSAAVVAESVIRQNHTREKAAELVSDNSRKLVADRVVKVENLIIDGEEVSDYETLYKKAPRELIQWITAAVHSTDILSEYEIKN